MKKFIPILLLFVPLIEVYPQISKEIYSSKNREEYLSLINDSLVEFQILIGTKGELPTLFCGHGIFDIKDSILTITTRGPSNCHTSNGLDSIKNEISSKRIDKYYFTILNNNELVLTGPILDNYKKLNRKRYFKGFLQWPWKWSFNKQHWFDPRQRILYK